MVKRELYEIASRHIDSIRSLEDLEKVFEAMLEAVYMLGVRDGQRGEAVEEEI